MGLLLTQFINIKRISQPKQIRESIKFIHRLIKLKLLNLFIHLLIYINY